MTEGLQQDIIIVNKLGLHARAAAKFVKLATQYQAQVSLERDDQLVDGKSIMDVLLLAAEKGSVITLHVSGADQDAGFAALKNLIETGFGE